MENPDAYSNRYLKMFHSELLPHICSAFNQAMREGSFPPEMLQATIVTLPKPGKPTSPVNFRPISLLNTDIKLYAKVLARCLLVILPSLINIDQVAFIKGRQAPDDTGRIINILPMLKDLKP